MRRKTNSVKIGRLRLSSDEPVMVQSMLNTPTLDTAACVEQAVRIIEAGGELVRITAPGVKEAENLKHIHAALRDRGYSTPLSADIHFVREAAMVAARYVEKVRINPGNFVDKRATFKQLTYTDEEYAAELELLAAKFGEFLDICKAHGTAVRIGTNHGSLSDRIMSRYGDTPEGMVEATMEYLRVCKTKEFEHVVISLKSSDCRVMVEAVRLLVREMEKEGMAYPLHLGVTEAGEGEDGRIRSAVGIGTLLNEGIGDTIRVSLTEAPEAEIPVAKELVGICSRPDYDPQSYGLKGVCAKPSIVADLAHLQLPEAGDWERMGFVLQAAGKEGQRDLKAPELIYVEETGSWLQQLPEAVEVVVPVAVWRSDRVYRDRLCPFLGVADYLSEKNFPEGQRLFVQITSLSELDELLMDRLKQNANAVPVLDLGARYQSYRKAFAQLKEYGVVNRVFIRLILEGEEQEHLALVAASQLGGLFLDRLPDGIWLSTPGLGDKEYAMELARNILQSAGVRRYKAEFISCPGCGRTLFDLQGAVAKVKQAFGQLSSLKIAVMGCVVNGPGEMGDADYGYVGAGNGKVNLYKGKQMVRAAIPEEEAIAALRELIDRDNG